MPRGRHRNASLLHRLLSPLSVAALAAAWVGGAWLSDALPVLRVIDAAAVTVAGMSVILYRRRDRILAGEIRRLQASRLSSELRADERVAELEAELDQHRRTHSRAEQALSAKRAELGGLRGEHALLLRRYATSQFQRAEALESARLALTPARQPSALTPTLFLKANAALQGLARSAARGQALRTVEAARQRETPAAEAGEDGQPAVSGQGVAGSGPDPQGPDQDGQPATTEQHARADSGSVDPLPVRPRGPIAAAAVAVVPQSSARARRSPSAKPGFDFFGNGRGAPSPAPQGAPPNVGQQPAAAEQPAAPAPDQESPMAQPTAEAADGGTPERSAPVDPALAADPTAPQDDATTPREGDGEAVLDPAPAATAFRGGEAGPRELTEPTGLTEPAEGQPPAADRAVLLDLTEHDETEHIDVSELRAL